MIKASRSTDVYVQGFCLRLYSTESDRFVMRFRDEELDFKGEVAVKEMQAIREEAMIGDVPMGVYPYAKTREIAERCRG